MFIERERVLKKETKSRGRRKKKKISNSNGSSVPFFSSLTLLFSSFCSFSRSRCLTLDWRVDMVGRCSLEREKGETKPRRKKQ